MFYLSISNRPKNRARRIADALSKAFELRDRETLKELSLDLIVHRPDNSITCTRNSVLNGVGLWFEHDVVNIRAYWWVRTSKFSMPHMYDVDLT
jgi:hypothetical protein